MYYFNKAVVNIYETTTFVDEQDVLRSSISDQGLYGMPVEILETVEEFYKIRTHYFYEGYVQKEHLIEKKSFVKNQKVVLSQSLDILMTPIVQSIPLLTLTRGCLIEVEDIIEKGYQKVHLLDGRTGYIPMNYLEKKLFDTDFIPYNNKSICACRDEEVLRLAIIKTAKSYLGAQYRWAGKTPYGIDCSGLTSMSYMLHGFLIYRDAKIMDGFPVNQIAREEMKPADLLYFPGHIAIYMGDGYYIHSTGAEGVKGVTINSLKPQDSLYRKDLDEKLYAVGSVFV
ncbi:MAG: NlpC/P60 family protein [Lachnospiraceae bacterium]